MTNHYTREEIINLIGEDAVKQLDAESCAPTNRAGFNGACQDDDQIEWSATVRVEHDDFERLTAYYYTSACDEATAEASDGDWGAVDFKIDHYSLY